MLSNTSSASAGSGRRRWRAGAALLLGVTLLGHPAAGRQAGDQAPATPRQQAVREIALAEAASRAALQLRRHSDFQAAIARDAEIEPSHQRGQRALATAKSVLARADQTQSPTSFGDAASLARRASHSFEDFEQRLRKVFARLEAERAPPPPPPPPPPPAPEPPTADGGETAAAAEPAPPPPPPPPRRSSRRPPAQLRQAADAYLAGDYQGAVGLLEDSFRGSRTRAHALLLRAAARYTLFLLGGETDFALRGQAADDVAACRRLVPDLAPPEDLFSPRFRDFFAATR